MSLKQNTHHDVSKDRSEATKLRPLIYNNVIKVTYQKQRQVLTSVYILLTRFRAKQEQCKPVLLQNVQRAMILLIYSLLNIAYANL